MPEMKINHTIAQSRSHTPSPFQKGSHTPGPSKEGNRAYTPPVVKTVAFAIEHGYAGTQYQLGLTPDGGDIMLEERRLADQSWGTPDWNI